MLVLACALVDLMAAALICLPSIESCCKQGLLLFVSDELGCACDSLLQHLTQHRAQPHPYIIVLKVLGYSFSCA